MKLKVKFRDDQHTPLRFSKAELRSMIVGGVFARQKVTEAYFGSQMEVDDDTFLASINEHIEETPLWQAYSAIYDYAFEGVPPEGDMAVEMTIAIQFRIEMIYAHEFQGWDIGECRRDGDRDHELMLVSGRGLEVVLCTFAARWKLDDRVHAPYMHVALSDFADNAYDLTLTDIALLADVQERNVRNYCHQDRPDEERLRTFKHGGRTRVLPADALTWLARRKRFVPTRVRDSENV